MKVDTLKLANDLQMQIIDCKDARENWARRPAAFGVSALAWEDIRKIAMADIDRRLADLQAHFEAL